MFLWTIFKDEDKNKTEKSLREKQKKKEARKIIVVKLSKYVLDFYIRAGVMYTYMCIHIQLHYARHGYVINGRYCLLYLDGIVFCQNKFSTVSKYEPTRSKRTHLPNEKYDILLNVMDNLYHLVVPTRWFSSKFATTQFTENVIHVRPLP